MTYKKLELKSNFSVSAKTSLTLKLAIGLGLSMSLLTSCGDVTSNTTESHSELNIIGGTEVSPNDEVNKHTVQVISLNMFGRPSGNCTGTLVLDGSYVATAAHCINAQSSYSYVQFLTDPVHSEDQTHVTYKFKHRLAISTTYKNASISQDIENAMMEIPKEEQNPKNRMKAFEKVMDTVRNKNFPDIALVKLVNFSPEDLPKGYEPIEFVSEDYEYDATTVFEAVGYGITLKPSKNLHGSDRAIKTYDSIKNNNEGYRTYLLAKKNFLKYTMLEDVPFLPEVVDAVDERFIMRNLGLQVWDHKNFLEKHRLETSNGSLNKTSLVLSAAGLMDDQHESLIALESEDPKKWSTICLGDSGGPGFIKEDGKLRLAGIASSSDFVYRSFFVDTIPYLKWFKKDAVKRLDNKLDMLKKDGSIDHYILSMGGDMRFPTGKEKKTSEKEKS